MPMASPDRLNSNVIRTIRMNFKRGSEQTPVASIEGGHYDSDQRHQGLARLAVYRAFEDAMHLADTGAITRDHALKHVSKICPVLLSRAGIEAPRA